MKWNFLPEQLIARKSSHELMRGCVAYSISTKCVMCRAGSQVAICHL